jgi:recombination protein RecA
MSEVKEYESTELFVSDLKKKFGESSICRLGERSSLDVKVRSSGSLMLDLALGGGYPEGRLVELQGKPKSGKSSLASLAIAEAQLVEDRDCAIIDLEQTFNPTWARTLGVDTDRLYISQPDTYAENIYKMIEMMLGSKRFSIIVLDSVAGLITKEELENDDWTKDRVGGTSRLNSKAMRLLVNSGLLSKSGTTLIFINQIRDLIGGFSMYGPQTTTTGGRALSHNYSQIIEVNLGEQFAKGTGTTKQVLGQKTKIKVTKNKIAAPYRTAELDLYYETGFDKVKELVDVAKAVNVLQGTSWIKLMNPLTGEVILDGAGNEMKFNGVVKAVEAINESIKLEEDLFDKVYELVNQVIRG